MRSEVSAASSSMVGALPRKRAVRIDQVLTCDRPLVVLLVFEPPVVDALYEVGSVSVDEVPLLPVVIPAQPVKASVERARPASMWDLK